MPACIALLSQATVSLWFTLTCVDKTRFMFSETPRNSLGTPIGRALQPAAVEQNGGDFALRVHELDLVTARFEDRHRIGRKARLHSKLVRHPLMMEARPVHRLLDVHLEIEDVQHGLEDRINDSRPTRRAQREVEL